MQDISVLYLSQITLIPGIGHRDHIHDYWHFTIALSGSSQTEADRPYCSCCPAGTINQASVYLESGKSINVMFLVHNSNLWQKLEAFPFSSLKPDELHIPFLMDIMERARDLNPGQDFIDFAFGHYLHLLFATHSLNAKPSRMATLTEKALSFIEDNYMHQIKVEDIAYHIGCSPSTISHVLKKTTGMTAVDHIREARIKNACRQLAYTGTPLDEVISSCGYISASYFHRVFKAKIGITPNQYRTSHAVNITLYHGDDAALDIPYQDPVYTYVPSAQKCIRWRTPREYISQSLGL